MTRPLAFLSLAALLAPLAGAQDQRDVQIRSVDFVRGTLEIFNFGSVDRTLDGWRFCSHDGDQQRVYSSPSGLNGVAIEAGTSVFVHFNDDAPGGDPDRVDRSSVGAFALPLDRDAFGIQFYRPDSNGSIAFGNSALIADHVQWSDGGSAGQSETRTGQAVGEGLWTAAGDFVSTNAGTNRIELNDLGNGRLHGPASYVAIGSDPYDETVEGDISDDRLAPTVLVLGNGSATVAAEQQGNAFGRDLDYLTIVVPSGIRLSGAFLDGFVAEPGNLAFIGVQEGATFTTDENSTGAADLLGGIVYGAGEVGTDILPTIGQLPGSTGFTAPLGAGSYTLWFNQTGPASEAILRFETEPASVGTPYCGPAAPNSTGVGGQLAGVGSDRVADNDLVLRAFDLPVNSTGFALASLTQGFVANPGGSEGNVCLGGDIGRFLSQVQSSGAAGVIFTTVDLTAIPQPTGNVAALAGETWNFQLWHRDSVGGASTSNFTEGLSVTLQ